MRLLAGVTVAAAMVAAIAGIMLLSPSGERRRDLLRPSSLSLLLLATDFVVRPFELVVGADTAFPDAAFERPPWEAIAFLEGLFVLWVAVFALAVVATTSALAPLAGRGARLARAIPDDAASARLVPVLAVVALAATAVAWAEHGVADLGFLAKTGRAEVSSVLRAPSLLLAYLGMAVAVSSRFVDDIPGKRRRRLLIGVAGFLVGAAISFTWSARDAALLPAVIPLLVLVGNLRRPTDARGWTRLVAAGLAVVVVLGGLGLGLRIVREQLIFDRTTQRASEGTVVRRVAVTANHTRFDTVVLIAEGRRLLHYESGEVLMSQPALAAPGLQPFADAFAVATSGQGADAAGYVNPARVVRSVIEPNSRNGWPLSALGDWYWAAGWWGVALGAAVSGLVFGALDALRDAAGPRAWAATTALAAMWATTITWGGVGIDTVIRARAYAVIPLAIVVAWGLVEVLRRRRRSARSTEGAFPAEDATSEPGAVACRSVPTITIRARA